MHVGTQTVITVDRGTQVGNIENNINMIITETPPFTHIIPLTYPLPSTHPFPLTHPFSLTYKINDIMRRYNKNINECGHPIIKWRDNRNIHKELAIKTIRQLRVIGELPPFWLVKRARFIIVLKIRT